MFLGLKALCSTESNIHIQLYCDNTSSCAYLRNFGGKKRELNDLAMDIWNWCIVRSIHLSVSFVAGSSNIEADRLSRKLNDDLEWALDDDIFTDIVKKFGEPDIDLFASRLNHKLDKYVSYYENSLELNFSEVLKHTRPGKHQDKIILQSYKNKSLCIVSLLQLYLKRTSGLRGQEMQLFIRTQHPFKGVGRATISRWVKTIMKEAGININLFKPHSTRAAASSAAKAKGVPLSVIMKSAGWSQDNTFRKFYDRPVQEKSCFQAAILGN